jgi:tRNA G18 (ribose-2'-O)-methylase SpoU
MKIIEVNNIKSPDLEPYRTLRRPEEHWKKGVFVAEGEKVVLKLLSSELKVHSLLLTQKWLYKLFPGIKSDESDAGNKYIDRLNDSTVYVAKKDILETIVGYRLHQGVMALASVPREPSLEQIIGQIPPSSIIVALDGLVNAENVGVIVRNCAAFGVELIITGETSSSPYLRRAVRNSMGAVFQLPVIHTDNLHTTLQILRKEYNYRIIAADPQENTSLFRKELRNAICIVFGNEDQGISEKVLEVCDEKISIPMMNKTDSLNVASASAVFLYEARKQREI